MKNGKLLTDQQVQDFIVSGYLTVQADYPPAFHEGICKQIDAVFDEEGNPGNNILPRIPDIGRIFEHPSVAGALTSLLGPGYILNPHRHCHVNPPGSKGQSWHKDCYVRDHNLRHPRFYWLLAFYYPQDTTQDMGPSGLLPGTQFYRTISDPNPSETSETEAGICGPAGTVALIHFDSWHRAIQNVSDRKRYMLKFQFARMQEPTGPTWSHSDPTWSPATNDRNPRVSHDVWNWLRGSKRNEKIDVTPPEIEEGQPEADRLGAAYQLARAGSSKIPELITSMHQQTLSSIDETTATTPDNAHGTNPTPGAAATALATAGSAAIPHLLDATQNDHWWIRAVATGILARMGTEAEEAIPSLWTAVRDDHWWVRRNAAEAFGMIGVYTTELVTEMKKCIKDDDYRVRRNAAITLAKIGAEADEAVSDISTLLTDENRYNRFYGTLALRRINNRKANQTLLDFLFEARWCASTNSRDMY